MGNQQLSIHIKTLLDDLKSSKNYCPRKLFSGSNSSPGKSLQKNRSIFCLKNWSCDRREERLPSGDPQEEFGRMIFQKKSSLGDRIKVQRQTLVEVRRGTGTCDAPCILERVLDSTFIKAKVRLSCSDSLIYSGRHNFRCHASPPRAAVAEL